MRPAILAGAMKLPLDSIDAPAVKKLTTYKHRPLGLADGEPDLEVEAWYYEGDFLCVPRQLGITLCNQLHIEIEDQTSDGFPAVFPCIPDPRVYQEPQIDQIVETFDSFYDFIFRAHTGWGKTVGSLIAAARMGRTTIVIVDQDNLREQWEECLIKLFGFKPEEIGIIQGPEKKWRWKGLAVTIAMVQTLSQKGVSEEMAEYYGTAIVDEVHTAGAPTFSASLVMFSAGRRLGVSATPGRRDGLQRALDHNLGKIRVAADKEHDRSAVYVIRHETVYSFYGNVSKMTGRIFSEVEEDGPRNMTIMEAALWLYESGRDVLILSDRIEQLRELMSIGYYLGVPEEEMGLYTGHDPQWIFGKDPKPTKRPDDLHRWKDDRGRFVYAEYSAVGLQLVRKRIPKATLKQVKERCTMMFATYGMCSKGFDKPSLTGGIDATPRSTAEQIHGRILRGEDGRPIPIWVTIADVNSYRLMYSFGSRVKEYLKSNGVLFEWHPDGSVEPCDVTDLKAEIYDRVTELKSMQIQTNSDGLNILLTAKDAQRNKRTAERAIMQKFQRPPARLPRHQ